MDDVTALLASPAQNPVHQNPQKVHAHSDLLVETTTATTTTMAAAAATPAAMFEQPLFRSQANLNDFESQIRQLEAQAKQLRAVADSTTTTTTTTNSNDYDIYAQQVNKATSSSQAAATAVSMTQVSSMSNMSNEPRSNSNASANELYFHHPVASRGSAAINPPLSYLSKQQHQQFSYENIFLQASNESLNKNFIMTTAAAAAAASTLGGIESASSATTSTSNFHNASQMRSSDYNKQEDLYLKQVKYVRRWFSDCS